MTDKQEWQWSEHRGAFVRGNGVASQGNAAVPSRMEPIINDLERRLADTEQRLAKLAKSLDEQWQENSRIMSTYAHPELFQALQQDFGDLKARLAEAERERDDAIRDRNLWRTQAEDADWHLVQQHERLTDAQEQVRVLREALEHVAKPATRRTDENSTICLRCGMETFHVKSGDVLHEKDCVQQFAAAALDATRDAAPAPVSEQ